MRNRTRFSWLSFWRTAAIIAALAGLVYGGLIALYFVCAAPKAGRFSSASLPRFELSTARVDAGRSLTIIFDKRTKRDYLLVETETGAALTPLPWKD